MTLHSAAVQVYPSFVMHVCMKTFECVLKHVVSHAISKKWRALCQTLARRGAIAEGTSSANVYTDPFVHFFHEDMDDHHSQSYNQQSIQKFLRIAASYRPRKGNKKGKEKRPRAECLNAMVIASWPPSHSIVALLLYIVPRYIYIPIHTHV